VVGQAPAADHACHAGGRSALTSLKDKPALEFVWVGDDAVDPLQQAQTLNILVSAGIKDARGGVGAGADGGQGARQGAGDNAPTGLRKFNPHHDERGQFATADGAVATVGSPARKPQPTGVQVASNDAMMSDVGGRDVAQIEPRPIEPPPPPPEPETPRPEESARATPTEFSLEAIVWGAPRLDKLIEAHFPSPDQHEDKLNPAFIEALEQIFAENGVLVGQAPAADHAQRGQLGNSHFALIEARQPPLKDQYDEWGWRASSATRSRSPPRPS
jgi:hypothetical protein